MPGTEKKNGESKEVSVGDATGDEILEAVREQRTITVERLDKYDAELKSMSDKVTDQAMLIKSLEEKVRTRNFSLPGVDLEKEKFSIGKSAHAIRTGDWSQAGFEKEIFSNTKDMSTGTGASGGYIIPVESAKEMIEVLNAKSIIMSMNPSVYSGLTGAPLRIPKQTAGAEAYWTAEAAEIAASNAAFGELSLNPKAIAGRCTVSNPLLARSNPSIDKILIRNLMQSMALKIDLGAIRGNGGENEPLGIANTEGINTVVIGTNGGTFTLDHAADMEGTLEDANALQGSLGYVMNGKVKRKLKKQKVAQYSEDTKGAYIMLPMSDSNLREMIGYDFKSTTQMPTDLTKGTGTKLSEIIFGNWQDLIIAEWGSIEIAVSEHVAFTTNQSVIRVIREMDIAVRHPESFCLINDAETV